MLKVNLPRKQKLSQVFHLTHLLPDAAESHNSKTHSNFFISSLKIVLFIYFISWLRRIWVKRSFWLWFQSICWDRQRKPFLIKSTKHPAKNKTTAAAKPISTDSFAKSRAQAFSRSWSRCSHFIQHMDSSFLHLGRAVNASTAAERRARFCWRDLVFL